MVHVAKMMILGPHGFLGDSLWLANLRDFYDEVTDLKGEKLVLFILALLRLLMLSQ